MRIGGGVRLEATVDAQGKVKDVKPVSGNHMLEVAAEDAVRQWKLAPGDGDAVVTVSVNLTLNQKAVRDRCRPLPEAPSCRVARL